MINSEIVGGQDDKLACLAAVRARLLYEGAKVFVVRPNFGGMLTALQVMSPVFKGSYNGKHLLVGHRVAYFGSLKLSREKGYWMPLVVFKELRVNGPKSGIGGVDLNTAFQSRVVVS